MSARRTVSAAIVSVMILGGSVLLAAPASAADSWLGERTCTPQQRCRSTSSTSGVAGVYPYRYTKHVHNAANSTNWPLTSSRTTRSFQSQTGSVDVFIYTTGTLHSQTASCVCVSYPCAT